MELAECPKEGSPTEFFFWGGGGGTVKKALCSHPLNLQRVVHGKEDLGGGAPSGILVPSNLRL